MSSPIATAPGVTHTEAPAATRPRLVTALVLMVANGSLERTGERVLIQEGETVIIGRHDPVRPTKLAHFAPHRPGMPMPPPSPAGGLPCPTVTHQQLRVTGTKDGLYVTVIGTRPTLVNGEPFAEGLVRGDDTIMLVAEAVLLCIWTPLELPMPPDDAPLQAFGRPDARGIPGESAAVWELRRMVDAVAASRQDVLVLGESGSGKSAVSRAIHFRSSRRNGPIIKRSAKHFTENMVESQLFGTEPGFVGAGKQSFDGLFPEAAGGTIILDEVGLAPHWLQEWLLSTLDDGVFTALGAAHESTVDVRINGTANQDPTQAFRPDFDARLALRVHVPPVREHRDDIGFMIRDALEAADTDAKGDLPSKRRISPTFVDFIVRHPLPTNARQIRNMVLQALTADTPGHVKLHKSLMDSIPASRQPVSVAPVSAPPVSQPRESKRESKPDGARRSGRPKEEPVRGETEVREALAAAAWDATKAAARLGISRGKMLRLMEKLGVKRPGP